MQLSELFDQLVHGELSNTVIGKKGINIENYAAMLAHINLGLYELYKRFELKKGSLIFQQYEDIYEYKLHNKYALSNTASSEPVKYIIDSVSRPFKNDVLKIETIEKVQYGDYEDPQYPINKNGNSESIDLSEMNAFTMPLPIEGELTKIKYRANHPRLILTELDPLEQEIELPVTHLESLLYFIASRYHGTTKTIDGVNEGTAYIAKFERSCIKISELGLVNKMEDENERISMNGWNQ